MPAVSRNQRVAAAIAEHHPEKLYKRNRGMLSMSREEMHKFASTVDAKRKKKRRRSAGLAGLMEMK